MRKLSYLVYLKNIPPIIKHPLNKVLIKNRLIPIFNIFIFFIIFPLIKSLENSNLSIINNMSSILNDETFNDTNKVKAMHSLVEIEKMNLKNILEQKSIIEAENLNRFDFIETISLSLQGKLSEIAKHIEFDEKSSNKNLIK